MKTIFEFGSRNAEGGIWKWEVGMRKWEGWDCGMGKFEFGRRKAECGRGNEGIAEWGLRIAD